MPLPYCNGPAISCGNTPFTSLSQLGHVLISASMCSTTFSNTISILVRLSCPQHGVLDMSSPQTSHILTSDTWTDSFVRLLENRSSVYFFPRLLLPGADALSSFSVCDEGLLEFLLLFVFVFSRKIETRSSTIISRHLNNPWSSSVTLPSDDRRLNSLCKCVNSSRNDVALTLGKIDSLFVLLPRL